MSSYEKKSNFAWETQLLLTKCFGQDDELADSTNRLLVIGFYLVNIGFICTRLDSGWNLREGGLIPDVASRVGMSILVLGVMHFFNMVMIAKFGRTVNGWLSLRENADTLRTKPLPSTLAKNAPIV